MRCCTIEFKLIVGQPAAVYNRFVKKPLYGATWMREVELLAAFLELAYVTIL